MAKTSKKPLVSIVIPVWNTAENVEKLIKKLFKQTYANLEIIAVDDGSTDNSLQVLRKLEKSDSQLTVIHQENAGVSAARNTGIDATHGEYLIFVDSDDDTTNDLVEKLLQHIQSQPDVAMVVSGITYNRLQENVVTEICTKPRRKRRKNERMADYLLELMLLDGRMYGVFNKIFRLEPIKKLDLRFEEGRKFAEDTKFVLDYLEYTPGEIEFVLEPLCVYNFGTETSTVKASSTVWENWEKSYNDLENWAKSVSDGKIHFKTKILLRLVRLRWRVSHYRAKKRAKKAEKNTKD